MDTHVFLAKTPKNVTEKWTEEAHKTFRWNLFSALTSDLITSH